MTYPEKINIYSLAVEVTENCNMLCPHCLRGDARDKDIDIDKFNIFLSLASPRKQCGHNILQFSVTSTARL